MQLGLMRIFGGRDTRTYTVGGGAADEGGKSASPTSIYD